jgi:hypothetical protein
MTTLPPLISPPNVKSLEAEFALASQTSFAPASTINCRNSIRGPPAIPRRI